MSTIPVLDEHGKLAYIWHFRWTEINATQFEKKRTDFKSDDFAAVCVVSAKVHYWRKYEPCSQGFFPERMSGTGKVPGVGRSILLLFPFAVNPKRPGNEVAQIFLKILIII